MFWALGVARTRRLYRIVFVLCGTVSACLADDPDMAARSAIAQVLGVAASAIGESHQPLLARGSGLVGPTTYKFGDGEAVLYPSHTATELRIAGRGLRLSDGPVSSRDARSITLDVVNRRFRDKGAQLSEVRARRIARSSYLVTWQALAAPHVATGDMVLLIITEEGELRTYAEVVAERRVGMHEVRVSREDAISMGRTRAQERVPFPVDTQPASVTLILSHRSSPQRGPVWAITYDVASATREFCERMTVLIDAETGTELMPSTPRGEP